jgi:hypothetical protein
MFDKFIKTKDPEIAERLTNLGLIKLSYSMGEFTFINNTDIKLSFSDLDLKKVHFS